MTHTLHRQGSAESLQDDYVVLVMSAKGKSDKGAATKLRKTLEILQRCNPVNMGNLPSGNLFRNGAKGIFKEFSDGTLVHAVFRTRDDLETCLKELKYADLGMSVVVSGLFDEVFDASRKQGITPHTIQYSLGARGNLKKLPPQDILNITTMCGHHLVSPVLVTKCLRDIKKERISLEEAARTLAKQCLCGVFNPSRAEKVLETLLATT